MSTAEKFDFIHDMIYSIDASLIRLTQTEKLTQMMAFTEEDLKDLKNLLQEYEELKVQALSAEVVIRKEIKSDANNN